MSYLEKAFYRYIKSIFTTGVKVFLSKTYRLYSVTFLLLTTLSTTSLFIPTPMFGTFPLPPSLLSTILTSIETSVAIHFIVYGVFLSRTKKKWWVVPFVISVAGVTVGFYYFPHVVPLIAMACFLTWSLLAVSLSFSFSRNFWGNKILGSVMFLGKKADEGTILFAPIVFLFALGNTGLFGYLLYRSVNLNVLGYPSLLINNLLLWMTSFFVFLGVVLILVIIFKLGSKNDVLFTIISFFYVFSSWTVWRYVFYSLEGGLPLGRWSSLIGSLFFLLFTFSGFGRKVQAFQTSDRSGGGKRAKSQDDNQPSSWMVLDLPQAIGAEGIAMCILGLFLGYHVTYLQLLFSDTFTPALPVNTFSELIRWKNTLTVIFVTCFLCFLLLSYYWSEDFRAYAAPSLYRFAFLPSFEELITHLEKIRSGEATWHTYVFHLMKEGIKKSVKSAGEKTLFPLADKLRNMAEKFFKGDEE